MTQPTHTPAPWTYKQSGDGKWIQIYGNGLEPHQNLAEVRRDDFISVDEDGDEPLANARLIAAAPELLNSAELDQMILVLTHNNATFIKCHDFAVSLGYDGKGTLSSFANKYRGMAIAKARG